MIIPKQRQTTAAVARHYDSLDPFYRALWGEHLHHGYWVSGRETVTEAAEALVDRLADRLDLTPGLRVCDIGCGYGATAGRLAGLYDLDVTGLTVSGAQAKQAASRRPARGGLRILHRDWLANGLPSAAFDRAYAVESSEHMEDKQRFFDEAARVLRPGGRLAICAWLAADAPTRWQIRHLLEPICREGRLPGMGTAAEYQAMAAQAGLQMLSAEDLSRAVARTWTICTRRVLTALATRPSYLRWMLRRGETERVFALTVPRIALAYRTGAMRYVLFSFAKPN
jgi:tocopherol O-methyltransferase